MDQLHPPTMQSLAVYAISVVGKTLRGRLAQQLEEHQLTLADVAALATLADLGPRSQRDLAHHVRIHPADMTRLVEALERRSFVVRERDPSDKRRQLVSVTGTGRASLRHAVADAQTIEYEALKTLTATERRHLRAALPKLLAGL